MLSTRGLGSPAMVRVAGGVVIALSGLLALWLVVRESVDINLGNAWTLVLAAVSGGLAVARPDRRSWLVASFVLLVAGIVTAMVGYIGYLYLPSAVVVALGAKQADSGSSTRRRQA